MYVPSTFTVYFADQQMHNIYINNILYIKAFLYVSMCLLHLQGVLNLYFAKVTKLLKLQINKFILL